VVQLFGKEAQVNFPGEEGELQAQEQQQDDLHRALPAVQRLIRREWVAVELVAPLRRLLLLPPPPPPAAAAAARSEANDEGNEEEEERVGSDCVEEIFAMMAQHPYIPMGMASNRFHLATRGQQRQPARGLGLRTHTL
jgi:hypothetical protein